MPKDSKPTPFCHELASSTGLEHPVGGHPTLRASPAVEMTIFGCAPQSQQFTNISNFLSVVIPVLGAPTSFSPLMVVYEGNLTLKPPILRLRV